VPVSVDARGSDSVTVSIPVTDSPRLLTIQEHPVTPRPAVVPALVMGGLHLRPRAFRTARTRRSIARLGGTVVSFTLSLPATTRFRVERLVRHGKHRRYRLLRGSFSYRGRAGRNRIRFTGRLRRKPLAAGSYRLVAVAKDASGRSTRTRRATFRVLR
jgi:hypothetical protein